MIHSPGQGLGRTATGLIWWDSEDFFAPPTTVIPTTVIPTSLAPTEPPTTAPPLLGLRRGISNFGFSMRDQWRL